MRYALDSNVCIGFMNKHAGVRKRFLAALGRGERIAVPITVLFELMYGVYKSARPDQNARSISEFLEGPVDLLAFSHSDADAAARIRAALEREGTPIGPYDVLIAGQAVNRGLTLITANVREFSRVPGLTLEDWSVE